MSISAPSPEQSPEQVPQAVSGGPRRWGWWLLLAVVLVLALVLLLGPTLFGQMLLARLSGDYRVTATGVGGPLWSPTLQGLKVTGPGVDVQAGTVGASLGSLDPLGRSARLNLSVKDATVALKLKTLLSGQKSGGASAFQILPGTIEVQNTRLKLDGTGFDVPSGSWTVQSLKDQGQDALKIAGATDEGPLNALLHYSTANGQFTGRADLNADARIINHYWHDKGVGGITGGQISGQYRFGTGPIQGDLKLTGASLAVPGATFVKVTGIGGTATHRGDLISFNLAGTGWDGPVTAQGSVDLKGHLWDVKAQAAPQLAALGKALGQGGKGTATLNVHAYGWNTVAVKGDIASPSGEFSVLPYKNLKATYLFRREKEILNNDLSFSADTSFQGQQKLSGNWTFNKAGTLAWTGELLSKPLNLAGTISARNVISASGQALGGPLHGSLGLGDKAVTLAASPDFYSVSGDLTAQGTLEALNIALRDGKAGPVPISGTATFGKTGLKADLGAITLDLDRQLRGTWRADGLSTAGLLLSGSGALKVPEASFTGNLKATVPLLSSQPSGPITLNWQKKTADWTFAGGDVTWRGDTFALHSDGLSALGYALRGDLALTTALKASGQLSATSGRNRIVATGAGDHIDFGALQNGVTLSGRTLLSSARNFPTDLRVQGADISGALTIRQGVQFTLDTAGSRARGSLDGQNWNATGDVNLASLSPLVGKPLSGTARLNLAGQGGTIRVAGSGLGASVDGVLTRQNGAFIAQANVQYALGAGQAVTAQLGGRVYPTLDLGGPVTVRGTAIGDQTVQTRVSGPYANLRASVDGQLTALTAGGVTLPAQRLSVQGRLTPALTLSGTYGDLRLGYQGGTAQVQGTQTLSALGYDGTARVDGTYGPGWAGRLTASGQLGPYTLTASGPWHGLNTVLTSSDGLRASGTVDLPVAGYDLQVRGPVAGLYVQGHVVGKGADPRGDLLVSDGSGGSARVTLSGLKDFQVQASGLTLAGQKVQGNLTATDGLLSGTLSAGPLSIVARSGQFQASGTLYSHTLQASGTLRLPTALSDLSLRVNGPVFSAQASGSGSDLRGSVRLKAQEYGGVARLPAQLLPLRVSVTPLNVNLGGLIYASGRWGGQTGLKYILGRTGQEQAGHLRLVGGGASLSAVPSGPVTGRLQVLPTLGGTLSASVSPLLPLLPAQVAAAVQPGQLQATLSASGATLSLASTRYQGLPLGLSADVNWKGGLKASGVVSHPGTRIPVRYDGQTLTVSGAVLDALALRPLLGSLDLTGSVRGDLSLPGLKLDRGNGSFTADLRASGQRAQGNLTLRGGTLSADLGSTLGGQTLSLRGQLYPQADAQLTLAELRATLQGDLRQQATLNVTGSYQGRAVSLNASAGLNPAQTTLNGTVAGLSLSLRAGNTGQSGWRLAGTFADGDLTALTGSAGNVNGTLEGPLSDLRLSAAGRVAGLDFTLPARYRGGVLSVSGASAAYGSTASARVSGTLYPALNLSAPVTLSDYLPGRYTVTALGTYSKPDLRLSGRILGGPRGLDAPGSLVTARLLGRDWKLTATGERLGGGARGQLGSGNGVPGGLTQARFTVHAPYRSGTQTVTLDGVSGWSPAGGFLGELRLGGVLAGQTLAATLRGSGPLAADILLGSGGQQATVSGLFPASLPLHPGGQLTLRLLDLGAFWGRPDQLRLSAEAQIGGTSWSALGARLNGQLADTAGELSGNLSASDQQGVFALALNGRKISGSASLNGGAYSATLNSVGVRLARLFPASAGVSALTLSGQASLKGSTSGGLEELRLIGLDLAGVQTQTGPFSLTGSALYTPQATQANLSGTAFGGSLSASGNLPSGLKVQLDNLKPTALGLDTLDGAVTLSGAVGDPALAGRLTLSRPELTATLDVLGRFSDPRLNAAATLRGSYAGRLLAEVQDVKLSPPSATVHVYGAASQGSTAVRLDLNGAWPKLSGTASAQLAGLKEPVTLTGDGQGSYALSAGTLGSGTLKLDGFVPSVTASAHLTPLGLIGGTGEASADLTLSGPLSGLSLSAQADVPQAEVSGVQLKGLAISVAGPLTGRDAGLNRLSGMLSQDGQPIGTLSRGNLPFTGLTASGYGFRASASGRATLSGTGSASLKLTGPASADLKAAYAGGSFALSGTAAASGVTAALNSTGSLRNGWNGTLTLDGGPAGVLTSPGSFTLRGPVAQPLLAGELGLGGAGVRIVANRQNVQLRLVDGPDAQASGVLNLDLARSLWEGRATYSRLQGSDVLASLAVRLSGAAGDPQASVEAARGTWKLSGTASRSGADLSVTDGTTPGRVRWDGQTVGVNLPGLALVGLNLGSLSGTLKATGTVNTATLDGAVQLGLSDFQSGYTIPSVNLPLQGDLRGLLTLKAGRVSGQANLASSIGKVALTLSQKEGGAYSGSLKAQIQQPASVVTSTVSDVPTVLQPGSETAQATVQTTRPGGTLGADLTLDASGLKGSLSAERLNLSLGGLNARLNGTATLNGQTFTAQAGAISDAAAAAGADPQVTLSSSGGLADLFPQLTALAGIQPTGEGYDLRASLNGLELAGLKVAPNLSGRVSGEAAISDGAGTFVLRSGALKLGDTVLSTRIEGTLVGNTSLLSKGSLLGGDWRIRGVVGNSTAATSQLSGSLSDGVLSGTFQMRGLPLDAFLSAFSGTLPGRGQLTGLARFRLPMADPLSGSVNVVAERVTVSSVMTVAADGAAGDTNQQAADQARSSASQADTPTTVTQTLTGSGFLRYADRELQGVDLHLSGAGRWDVTGQYTHKAVGVTASFQNTTFTPVLLFIPSLREQSPSLQGTLSLSVMGSYDRPVGTVSGSNLQGALGSISLKIAALSGQLPDSGLFTARAGVQAGGSLGGQGTLDVSGKLDNLKLSNLKVQYAGLLIPNGLGRIENVQATIAQVNAGTPAEGYTVQAQATSAPIATGAATGTLNIQGSLSPRYDLRLSARSFNLPISVIYGRQSSIDADLSAVEQGRTGSDGPIVVSGAVRASSLLLGTGGAVAAVLPAPGSSTVGAGDPDKSGGTVDYTTPLPESLSTFPVSRTQAAARRVSPLLSRVTFQNIPISAPSGVRVDESIARAELGGNLVLSGTGSTPKLSGQVQAIRGNIDLRDNTFTVDSGSATFDGTSLYPTFTASATGNVPLPTGGLVGVNLAVNGRFGPQPDGRNALTLDTKLSCTSGCVSSAADLSASNPNAEAQLYSLVAVGTPDLTSLPNNLGAFGTSALKTALNLFVLGEVQRNIARALGVDVFQINAALPGENGSTGFGATFTVGSYLTKQLYLQYRIDLTGAGLLDATYTTPDNLFTFKASTPITGLDLSTLRPSFSAAYNFTNRSSVQLGVQSGSGQSGSSGTQINFGYIYRW